MLELQSEALMTDLSPQLTQLVQAGKAASRPTEGDSARILAGLRTRLGDAALLSAEATQAVATNSATGVLNGKLLMLAVVGTAILGGFLFYASLNHRATPVHAPAGAALAATTSAASERSAIVAPVDSVAMAPAPSPPADSASVSKADRTDVRTTASKRARDSLPEEVAILSRAETDLRSGKPDSALKLLNEHERKFPNGILTEERIAARAQALCALGRNVEADAQLARLSPKSLHGAQVSQACGARKSN
jgi:hypothetical protein